MSLDLAGKRVFVLSDNNGLARAIEVSLACNCLEIFRSSWNSGKAERCPSWGDDLDLIVVALSLPDSDPAVLLTHASLDERIGEVPLLVISEQPFDEKTEWEHDIAHLNFPFDLDSLYEKVEEMLENGR